MKTNEEMAYEIACRYMGAKRCSKQMLEAWIKEALDSKDTLITELREAVMKLDCLAPQGHDTEYVSQDMATDAGEPDMAGSVYREAEWQRCGGCQVCVLQQKFAALLSSESRPKGNDE